MMLKNRVKTPEEHGGVTVVAMRQVIRGSSLMGSGDSGPPALVDVKDGRITRIRPLRYDLKYDPRDFNLWKIEARGKTFTPPLRAPLGPIGLAYKKRVYSKNRVLYPLKRIDWDPQGPPGSTGQGGRNTQNRGQSKYVRISWDEAAEIVAKELLRVRDT
ncbi:MAG: molybdopterin-dependent oxidoreductase, partial [Thermoleophilia bacterium]|nr:molybdopterin-dependent oxidoreductase [Thermoleophilia bacterium]